MARNTPTYQCTLFKREFTPHILDIALCESKPVLVCVPTKHAAESLCRAARHQGLRAACVHANRSHAGARRAFDACEHGALDILAVTPRVLQDVRIVWPHVAVFSDTAVHALAVVRWNTPVYALILRTERDQNTMSLLEHARGACIPCLSRPPRAHTHMRVIPRTWKWLRRHRTVSPWRCMLSKQSRESTRACG